MKWLVENYPLGGAEEFIFYGDEYQLEVYMQENYSCNCESCKGIPFWDSIEGATEWGYTLLEEDADLIDIPQSSINKIKFKRKIYND